MPHADNGGVRIYYEVEGAGPPLLMHHGWLGSADVWWPFRDALAGEFRIVALDARGHRRSGKPHDPAAYAMDRRADDVRAVLDAADVGRVHYWGYSMGGRTGYGFAHRYPERVASLIIGGAHPYPPAAEEQRFQPLLEALRSRDAEAIAATIGTPIEMARRIADAADPEALAAERRGLASWEGVDPAEITATTLSYAGGDDPVLSAQRRAAEAMPDARFHVLEGVGHMQGALAEDVLPLVREFVRSVAAR